MKGSGLADTSTLTSSVANAAETFIHDELNDSEEEALRGSIYEQLPGGFSGNEPTHASVDPFQTVPATEGFSENDPEGISIFARLIERLLSRFNFDLARINVKLLCSGQPSIIFSIGSVHYSTEDTPSPDSWDLQGNSLSCQTHSLEISGVSVSLQHDRANNAVSVPSPAASDKHDSDSEMDEETQMMMSHSMLNIRDQLDKPFSSALSTISSAASSMYESAISAAEDVASDSIQTSQHLPVEAGQGSLSCEDYPIMTFVEPILLQLTTPPPYIASAPNGDEDGQNAPVHRMAEVRAHTNKLKLHLSLGTIAISASAQTVLVATNLMSALQESTESSRTKGEPTHAAPASNASILDRFDCSLHCRAIVVLLHKPESSTTSLDTILAFHSHPLDAPRIDEGCIRIHIDRINSRLSTSHFTSSSSHPTNSIQLASCTIADISILAFHSLSSLSDNNHCMHSPILITDTHLLSSYHPRDFSDPTWGPESSNRDETQLPSIKVNDWTFGKPVEDEVGTHHWKTKTRSRNRSEENQAVRIEFFGPAQGSSTGYSTTVQSNLLHVFLDLSATATITSITAEIARGSNSRLRSKATTHKRQLYEDHKSEEYRGQGGVVQDVEEYTATQLHLERFISEDRQTKLKQTSSPHVTGQKYDKSSQRSDAQV